MIKLKKIISFLVTLMFVGNIQKITAMIPKTEETEVVANIKICPTCSSEGIEKIASRTLPCSHAFCTNCLVTLHALCTTRKIPTLCPTCQTSIFSESDKEGHYLRIKLESNRTYKKTLKIAKQEECSLCSTEEMPKIGNTKLPCAHNICTACFVKHFTTKKVNKQDINCPFCRAQIFSDANKNHLLKMQLLCHHTYPYALQSAKESLELEKEKELEERANIYVEAFREMLNNLTTIIYDKPTLHLIKVVAVERSANALISKVREILTIEEQNKLYRLWMVSMKNRQDLRQ